MPKFNNADEMFIISKMLSKGKKYVRIDMYQHEKNLSIGEMTFFPTAGFICYFTKDFLNEIGSWLDTMDWKSIGFLSE